MISPKYIDGFMREIYESLSFSLRKRSNYKNFANITQALVQFLGSHKHYFGRLPEKFLVTRGILSEKNVTIFEN